MSSGSAYADATVLVTGAQGFMGSWLVERLLGDGARVVALRRSADERSRFRREGLEERCHLVEADLADAPSLLRTLHEYDVRIVFHLGAQTIVGTANRSPLETYETNTRGTYNLLEACRLADGTSASMRVVVASSYHVYGPQGNRAYSEELGLRATYPYDVSKACADALTRCYAHTWGLPVAVTRLANVYGGGDLNYTRLVPDAARALVEGRRPVIRSDGTPGRDYLYVEDAVEAYLAVAESLREPDLGGRAWNAGQDAPVSVLEVVRRLISASGREVEPEVQGVAGPRDEIDRQYLDSSAIREQLGWRPRFGLDEGLRATYEWYERALA